VTVPELLPDELPVLPLLEPFVLPELLEVVEPLEEPPDDDVPPDDEVTLPDEDPPPEEPPAPPEEPFAPPLLEPLSPGPPLPELPQWNAQRIADAARTETEEERRFVMGTPRTSSAVPEQRLTQRGGVLTKGHTCRIRRLTAADA